MKGCHINEVQSFMKENWLFQKLFQKPVQKLVLTLVQKSVQKICTKKPVRKPVQKSVQKPVQKPIEKTCSENLSKHCPKTCPKKLSKQPVAKKPVQKAVQRTCPKNLSKKFSKLNDSQLKICCKNALWWKLQCFLKIFFTPLRVLFGFFFRQIKQHKVHDVTSFTFLCCHKAFHMFAIAQKVPFEIHLGSLFVTRLCTNLYCEGIQISCTNAHW